MPSSQYNQMNSNNWKKEREKKTFYNELVHILKRKSFFFILNKKKRKRKEWNFVSSNSASFSGVLVFTVTSHHLNDGRDSLTIVGHENATFFSSYTFSYFTTNNGYFVHNTQLEVVQMIHGKNQMFQEVSPSAQISFPHPW